MSSERMASALTVVPHPSAAVFLERAEAWLVEHEAENSLLLGVAMGLAARGGPLDPSVLLVTVEQDGEVVGCAFRTPPHKVGLTRMPIEAVPHVVEAVAQRYERIPAVLGFEDGARHFARLWAERKGVAWRPGMRQRIYQLDAVTWPESMPAGRLRPATSADMPTIRSWVGAFADEVHLLMADAGTVATDYVERGVVFVWDDQWARAMAVLPAVTPNGVRIGYVYTPPDWRGRGYASACVAHLSAAVLDSGSRHSFLFTDVSNPASNAIYQHIGYRPVCDVIDFDFMEHAE